MRRRSAGHISAWRRRCSPDARGERPEGRVRFAERVGGAAVANAQGQPSNAAIRERRRARPSAARGLGRHKPRRQPADVSGLRRAARRADVGLPVPLRIAYRRPNEDVAIRRLERNILNSNGIGGSIGRGSWFVALRPVRIRPDPRPGAGLPCHRPGIAPRQDDPGAAVTATSGQRHRDRRLHRVGRAGFGGRGRLGCVERGQYGGVDHRAGGRDRRDGLGRRQPGHRWDTFDGR